MVKEIVVIAEASQREGCLPYKGQDAEWETWRGKGPDVTSEVTSFTQLGHLQKFLFPPKTVWPAWLQAFNPWACGDIS